MDHTTTATLPTSLPHLEHHPDAKYSQSCLSFSRDQYFKTPDQESTEVSESEILQLMMNDMLRNNFKKATANVANAKMTTANHS